MKRSVSKTLPGAAVRGLSRARLLRESRRHRVLQEYSHLFHLGSLLAEPCQETARLLRAYNGYQRGLHRRRNRPQSPAAARRIRQRLACPQAAAFRHLSEADPRSRIIACFHFGDFVYGVPYLHSQEPASRSGVLLIQSRPSAAYLSNVQAVLPEAGIDESGFMVAAEHSPLALLRYLRQPRRSLYLFCDLPEGFGAAGEVRFLSRRARFPRGAATLALRAGVPLLPVITVSDRRRDVVTIGEQLEGERRPGEGFAAAAARLSQSLVDFFRPYFRRRPQHWKYLPALPEYIIGEGV